jgi:integrase
MARRRRGRGEGSVFYSDSKGCWVGRAIVGVKPTGAPKYREVTARSQAEALRKKLKAEADATAGRVGDTDRMTVGQYLAHWLDNVSKPSVEATTWASYERCVRLHLTPRLGGIKLAQLRPVHVETMFAEMRRDGVSGGNAKKVSEVLSTALEHAARVGVLTTNPAAPVPKPKAEGDEINPFTPDEVRRILAAATRHRLEALFAVAVGTGMRQGELLGLGRDHVDYGRGASRVERTLAQDDNGPPYLKEPKSKRGRRVVDLPGFAVEALRRHYHADRTDAERLAPVLFCTRTGGFLSKSSFICQVYKPLLKRAGVPYRKFHTFRHTHVSELLSRGESVVDVARRVGDRPDVILKTYAHFLPGSGATIGRRLDEMYGSVPQGGDKVESGAA